MLSFRYHSTNCFFLRSEATGRLLAVDAGWPCTLFEHARMMKTIGCQLEQIEWAVVTHFHMDHAGLVGEFQARGITCFALENQRGAVEPMERTILKNRAEYTDYRKIDATRLRPLESAGSGRLLSGLGIKASVIVTNYHSPDSITLVTDGAEAIVGDLPPLGHMMPGDARFLESWRRVWEAGARAIFPSHAAAFQLEEPGRPQ